MRKWLKGRLTHHLRKAKNPPDDDTKVPQINVAPSSPAAPDSTPNNLWQQALDKLPEKDRKLVDDYQRGLISQELEDSPDNREIPSDDVGGEPAEQLKTIVQQKLDEMETNQLKVTIKGKEYPVKDQFAKGVQAITAAKDYISFAIAADPHASLAWAGVLLVLPIMMRPITAEQDAVNGFSYISNLLIRCNVIEDNYNQLRSQPKVMERADSNKLELHRDFIAKTVDLYSQILRYQMRFARHLNLPFLGRVLTDLAARNDWVGMLTGVQNTEGSINTTLDVLDRDTLNKVNDGVTIIIKNSEQSLVMLQKNQEGIEKTQEGVESVIRAQEHARQDSVLEKLTRIADAAYDSSETAARHIQCLENTRTNLLHKIQCWTKANDSQYIFWLNGVAGTGKSTVTKTVASELAKQGSLGASFFFSRGSGERGRARYLITTLAVQLAQLQGDVRSDVVEAVDEQPDIDGKSLDKQWPQLIMGPLVKRSPGSPIVFVIDALDECDNEVNKHTGNRPIEELLELFAQLKDANVPLRILISSRPEVAVKKRIPAEIANDVNLYDTDDSIQDVSVYLRHRLSKIRENRCPDLKDWPGKEKMQALVHRAGKLFIYASTACSFLDDKRYQKRLEDLMKNRKGMNVLHEIYTQVLENAVHQDTDDEEEQLDTRASLNNIIGTVVVLFAPLSANELGKLVSLNNDTDLSLIEYASLVPSLLRVTDGASPIRFHLSLRDYFLDVNRKNEAFWADEAEVHSSLVHRLIDVMSHSLKKDVCGLGKLDCAASDIDPNELKEYLPLHVQYACCYWVRHLQQSAITSAYERGSKINYERVLNFLREHFLHWLEALSLMRRMPEAVLMITALQSMLDSTAYPELYNLVDDARMFLLSFKPVIEKAPLQAYHSAIVFSPTRSVVRLLFLGSKDSADSAYTWVKCLPEIEDWSLSARACKQKLEGHTESVTAVAFSCDGLLASGSEDGTVRTWDPAMGECKQILNGHTSYVWTVAFSGNGLLASGSFDKTVRVWNLATGECKVLRGHTRSVDEVAFLSDSLLASIPRDNTVRVWNLATDEYKQLNGHTKPVRTVAFSGDGLIASGSEDGTVRTWDLVTGECRQILNGHTRWVNTVAFSGNDLLASGSNDDTVRVWNLATGECKELSDHTHTVNIIAFSKTGLLASGSDDKTMRIWDPTTGECKQILNGHISHVGTVAFSDNSLLASGSYDNTVRVWDPATGKCMQTLSGHTESVTAVAFSRDGLLASGSKDGTVRTWDPAMGECKQILNGHTSYVWIVAFSDDGLLASGSSDNTVGVWDPTTGECKQIMSGHTSRVWTVAFSKHGLLASGSLDNTIRVWDPATGECKQILNGHTNSVSTVVFSDNGLLASGSYDNTVKVWDPNTGECKQTLSGHTDPVSTVVFSADNSLLASGSDDNTVRVWDPTTGRCKQTLSGHTIRVTSVAFSADNSLLASGSFDITVRVWDPATGECKHILNGHTDWINIVAFSDDGLLASQSDDHSVRVWDPTTGEYKQNLEGLRLESGIGRINLGLLSSSDPQPPLYSLTTAGEWVTQNTHRCLLLPDDHRPGLGKVIALAVKDNILVVGHDSGQLTFLNFNASGSLVKESLGS